MGARGGAHGSSAGGSGARAAGGGGDLFPRRLHLVLVARMSQIGGSVSRHGRVGSGSAGELVAMGVSPRVRKRMRRERGSFFFFFDEQRRTVI